MLGEKNDVKNLAKLSLENKKNGVYNVWPTLDMYILIPNGHGQSFSNQRTTTKLENGVAKPTTFR